MLTTDTEFLLYNFSNNSFEIDMPKKKQVIFDVSKKTHLFYTCLFFKHIMRYVLRDMVIQLTFLLLKVLPNKGKCANVWKDLTRQFKNQYSSTYVFVTTWIEYFSPAAVSIQCTTITRCIIYDQCCIICLLPFPHHVVWCLV